VIELAVVLIVCAMVLLSVALAAKGLTHRQRGWMALSAAAISFTGLLLSEFSSIH
jgi:hypothetical protein